MIILFLYRVFTFTCIIVIILNPKLCLLSTEFLDEENSVRKLKEPPQVCNVRMHYSQESQAAELWPVHSPTQG